LHLQLRNNPEYRLLFADHVYKYFFNDGRLTPNEVAAQFALRAAEIDKSIVAESARWGDAKREPPYTRDVEWANELSWVMNTFIPQRTGVVLNQFRADGLYPTLGAPEYQIDGTPRHNGLVAQGSGLSIVDPNASPTAQVYYTLDGTDPR